MRRNLPQGKAVDRIIYVDKRDFIDTHFVLGCAFITLFSTIATIFMWTLL